MIFIDMISKEDQLKLTLINKRLNSRPIKFDGIELIHYLTENYFLEFEMKITKDISYYTFMIKSYIEEYIYDFLKKIGLLDSAATFSRILKRIRFLFDNEFYISKELHEKIDESCSEITEFELKTTGGKVFRSDCRVDFQEFDTDAEYIYMFFTMEILNPSINGVRTLNPDEIVETRFFHDNLYDNEHETFSGPLNVIWNGPKSLFNQETGSISPRVSYHYRGKSIFNG